MYRTFQFWWRSWFGQQSASGRLSEPQFVVGLSSAQPAWPPFAGCVPPLCWLPTLPLPKVWLLAAAATCKESWATTVLFARDFFPMRLAWLVNWGTTSTCWTWRLCSSLLLWDACSRCYWYFHIKIYSYSYWNIFIEIYSYWNIFIFIFQFQIYFSFSLQWGAPTWIPAVFQPPKSQSFPIRQALSLVVSLWPIPGQMLLVPSLLSYSFYPFWLFASAQAGQGVCPIALDCR